MINIINNLNIYHFVSIWILRGVFQDDITEAFYTENYGSSKWFLGGLVVFSIMLSITSLVVTILYYNKQAERPAGKFFSSLFGTITSIFFRVFIFSILFAHVPGPAFGILAAIYCVNLGTLAVEGSFKRIERFLCSYCSIISPFGYGGQLVRIVVPR
jgi:hypothetical protein